MAAARRSRKISQAELAATAGKGTSRAKDNYAPNVRYRVADAGDGHAVTIQDAAAGTRYTCFGCGAAMVARRGTQRAWHFAHKPPVHECADPDRALHETAKAIIWQGFTEAVTQRNEYHAGFCCEDCGTNTTWNIAKPGSSITPERTVVDRTRSDIVIDRVAKGTLIIEVVVTHEIDDATKLRYKQSGLPVFVIHPQWDSITELTHTLIADDAINLTSMRCPACQQATNRRKRELSEAVSWAHGMLTRLDTTPEGTAEPQLRLWQRDKFGRELHPHVKKAVHQNAYRLRRLGFSQSKRKPWLLMFQSPDRRGVVFANFGSTEEVPIWEDTSALIHWQLHHCSDAEEEALVRLVLRKCRAVGVEVRVSFYDQHFE